MLCIRLISDLRNRANVIFGFLPPDRRTCLYLDKVNWGENPKSFQDSGVMLMLQGPGPAGKGLPLYIAEALSGLVYSLRWHSSNSWNTLCKAVLSFPAEIPSYGYRKDEAAYALCLRGYAAFWCIFWPIFYRQRYQ